ncbi:4c111411-b7ca-45eb-8981-c8c69ee728d4-CDS [Sclerotinia trifoliorum]|uniref:4c111411-b7ca-45eb-8981-c8c69ee728d4-CDS n=1 Tax=Sclerotinia trifoliorum TaxID=28548 RepID=A0A8H2W300_9HELO|nr:4c111411-b7ca-45eb-8981-c8c69ee728d4-CDS [Sclerotinia trifoliorum]
MRKVFWRGNHTIKSTFQFFRVYPKWGSLSQYSTKPRKGFLGKIHSLLSRLTARRQDEGHISKNMAQGKSDHFHERSTAKTLPEASSILHTIMHNIESLATEIGGMDVDTAPAISLTDTPKAIIKLIDLLARSDLPTAPPSIYIDLEGIQIGRNGSISIIQVYFLPTKESFLVDVHTLREQTFSTPNKSGVTLKSILESQLIPKVIFDVRNDSDALYSHFGIKLGGVIDLQLLELATRSYGRDFLCGLAKCMERDLMQTPEELKVRGAIKQRGIEIFAPEKGGRYEVFNDRPLDPAIVDYCVQDVQLLPELWEVYNAKLSKLHKRWVTKIEQETKARILLSQSAGYIGEGRHKARAPSLW